MARNRKRAKERRARRPQPVITGRAEREEPPGPIRHATPDVELAEAQLALGRPELVADEPQPSEEPEPEFDEDEDVGVAEAAPGFDGEGPPSGRGGELAVPGAPAPAERARATSRLVNFVRGSWRELQRVQWPDRRQVVQATGVVLGFVLIAGVFLGVADTLAGHIMNYVLTGKW